MRLLTLRFSNSIKILDRKFSSLKPAYCVGYQISLVNINLFYIGSTSCILAFRVEARKLTTETHGRSGAVRVNSEVAERPSHVANHGDASQTQRHMFSMRTDNVTQLPDICNHTASDHS